MSGLAKYLLQEGFEGSGSDINDSKYIDEIRSLGAKVYIGHDEKNGWGKFLIPKVLFL